MGKAGALLAYLASNHGRRHSRDILVELLWPDCESEAGRSRLSVLLSSLRRQLEFAPLATPVLEADRFSVGLRATVVITDVEEFCRALEGAAASQSDGQRIRLLTDAIDLYRGELLPGYYEAWIVPERQRLEELFFQALRQLSTHLSQAGDLDQAVRIAHRAVGADPLREEAHRELIRLYVAAGQPRAARRQYDELKRLLKQQLDDTPDAATRALVRAIEQRPDPSQPACEQQPPLRSARADANPSISLPPESQPSSQLEPVGGAVPLDSPFYVVRPADLEFAAAIRRQDSIVLVKGPRQVGKTSLLARGLQQARAAGARVVHTDLEILNAEHLSSAERLLQTLGLVIADQLELDVSPADTWESRRGANLNFRRYMQREVLEKIPAPIVWGLDEVDRLFHCDFGSEIFGLFRSWHNQRALDPTSPWLRLTLAMAYATEAHLFVADLNQSPFNVGTGLTLGDFGREQVADLNRRYGSPLRDESEVQRYYRLVGGHPHLVRGGLHEMAARSISMAAFEAQAGSNDGAFGNHLRRLLLLLRRDPELCDVVRAVLRGNPCPTPDSFYRLRSAGLVVGSSEEDARLRCQLYEIYLKHHLT